MHSWNEDLAHTSDQSGHANSDSISTQKNSAPLTSGAGTYNYTIIYGVPNMIHSSFSKDINYEYCLATDQLEGA